MSFLMECPRCEKRVPQEAAFCRRCGLPLAPAIAVRPYSRPPRPVRPASPPILPAPVARLAAIILVGFFFILLALSNSDAPYTRVRSPGGGGGGGGGGGTVVLPVNPFGYGSGGPNVQTTPGWPQGYEPPQPGRIYTPGYDAGPGRYGRSYGNPYAPGGARYGNPSGGPYGGPYGGPSSPGGGSRGPGR